MIEFDKVKEVSVGGKQVSEIWQGDKKIWSNQKPLVIPPLYYINLNYILKNTGKQKIIVDFMSSLSLKNNDYQFIIGARVANSNDTFCIVEDTRVSQNIGLRIDNFLDYNISKQYYIKDLIGIRTKVEVIRNKAIVNLKNYNIPSQGSTSVNNLFVNNCNQTNALASAYISKYSLKIYSIKIFEDDILVRNYIPNIKNNCLFDTITNKNFPILRA